MSPLYALISLFTRLELIYFPKVANGYLNAHQWLSSGVELQNVRYQVLRQRLLPSTTLPILRLRFSSPSLLGKGIVLSSISVGKLNNLETSYISFLSYWPSAVITNETQPQIRAIWFFCGQTVIVITESILIAIRNKTCCTTTFCRRGRGSFLKLFECVACFLKQLPHRLGPITDTSFQISEMVSCLEKQ